MAAAFGHKEIVKFLIENNADINAKLTKTSDHGYTEDTALIFAAKHGHIEVVEILLKNNPDVNLNHFYRILVSGHYQGFWNYFVLSCQAIYTTMQNIVPPRLMKIF